MSEVTASGVAPTLHVMFGMSAAGSLRQALELAGRDERVVGCPDDLSHGPLDPPDAAARMRWYYDLNDFDDEAIALQIARVEAFWREAVSTEYRLVAWMSRRATSEYCGFLEWLWRMGDRARYHDLWQGLRAENAPLRVFQDGRLRSASLSFYDARLLSHAKPEWLKSTRIVGAIYSDYMDDGLIEVGDGVLWARVLALVESGKLEARGDLTTMRGTEVRLPAPAGAC